MSDDPPFLPFKRPAAARNRNSFKNRVASCPIHVLPSILKQVSWKGRRTAEGDRALLEIEACRVGGGSPVRIELLNLQGEVVGSPIERCLHRNRLEVEVLVPEGLVRDGQRRGALVAKVVLPEHSPLGKLTAPLPIVSSMLRMQKGQ